MTIFSPLPLGPRNEHRGRPGFPAICWRQHQGEIITDGSTELTEVSTGTRASVEAEVGEGTRASAGGAVLWKTLPSTGERLYVLQADAQGAVY